MGRSYFLTVILVSVIFTLLVSNGSGRKLLAVGGEAESEFMGREEVAREAYELMDYDPTGPNFNSRSALPTPSTQPPPFPPPSSP